MKKGQWDMVRINAVENGFVISLRQRGQKPQSYGYTEQLVARTWAEVIEVLQGLDVNDG